MRVEVQEHLEDVGPVAWGALHAASALRSPFLTYTWQQAWIEAFAAGRRVAIRTVKGGDDALVAALPLCETAPAHWTLVGGADVSDYLDLLAVAGQEADAWRALLAADGEAGIWELHAVPAASPTVLALPALAAAAGAAVDVVIEEHCPVLTLPSSWDAYLAGLSGKHRHELMRKIRRLQREAPDARVTCVSGAGDVAARFDDFLDLHRRSRVGKAKFMDERMEGFFRSVILALAGAGGARLWLLDTAEGPIASFVTLEWDATVGLYNSGFHPDRASLSPGLVLLARLVEDAIARGKARFDFLRGEERYKYEFGPTPEPVHAVRIERGGAGVPT